MRSRDATRRRCAITLPLLALTLSVTTAQDAAEDRPAVDPLAVDRQDQVEVRLVLIDAVVLDRHDRTVPDLGMDDFEITVDGRRHPIDTLDVSCAAGAADDPRSVRDPSRRPVPAADVERKLVLALDYLHLSQLRRVDVLEHAKRMVRHGAAPGDKIMVAALNGGLRIEQSFTPDHARVIDALERMEYDISLWQPSFSHLTEEPFFAGLRALLEVLAFEPGSKGVVLFSNSPAAADENDLEFARLAAVASASRCSIYPVHAEGVTVIPPG
jgi:VWFA-related protein